MLFVTGEALQVNELATRPCVILVASTAAATRAASVSASQCRRAWASRWSSSGHTSESTTLLPSHAPRIEPDGSSMRSPE
jgi:hypothetical protein